MKILIIDDKIENSYLLESLLRGSGYDTAIAANGAEALEIARNDKFGLIISDILMPVMDGFTFCKECKKDDALKSIPFIFYTATYTDSKDEDFALSLGADRYLIKPQDPDDLMAVVEKLLEEYSNKKIPARQVPAQDEEIILREYNSILIRKLEDKMKQTEDNEKVLKEYVAKLEESLAERKKAEQIIMTLSSAIEQNPVAVVITDINGKIEYVNPKFTELTGYSHDEVVSKNYMEYKTQAFSSEEFIRIIDTVKSGNKYQTEVLSNRKDGKEYWEEVVFSVIYDQTNGPAHLLINKKDISEDKRILQELIQAKNEAEKSDSTKTNFLAQMSHEIRTPLNALMNYISLLRDEIGDDTTEDTDMIFEGISNAGSRIIRTIELILNASELQAGAYSSIKKRINLYDDVVVKVRNDLKHLAEYKGLDFRISCLAEDATVECDAYSVYQSVINIADNSIKYTEKGKIDIRILRNENSKLILEIEDSGIGIADEYIDHIYEAFSQEEAGYTRRFEGTGLGLAIVKKYSELNNIQILLHSEKGKGTKFTLVFNE